MSINCVVLSGNLTREPETRVSQSGSGVLTFGMAVNDRRRNQQTGEWEDYPNFVDVVVFGNRTDFLSRTLHKGMKVMVEGKLRYSAWERDGQKRSKLEVVADDIDLPPRQREQGQQPQGSSYAQQYQRQQPQYQQQYQPQQQAAPQGYSVPDVYDEDFDF